MPSYLQEVVTDLCEVYGLDLSQSHTSLQIQSRYPGFLLIHPLGTRELLVAYVHEGQHGTMLYAPGIVFGMTSTEWQVLEVVQDDAARSRFRFTHLETETDIVLFCDRFAQVILMYWNTGFVLFKLMQERTSSPPHSESDEPDL